MEDVLDKGGNEASPFRFDVFVSLIENLSRRFDSW